MADEYLLRMDGISKSFPGVRALDDVHLEVMPGTVHALMGENGAGKSTLMKVLIGMYHADRGSITLGGQPVVIPDTATALRLGISMIHQELSPVPEMEVYENIYLGREPRNRLGLIDKRRMIAQTRELFARWEIDINPRAVMKDLSVAQTQMVEIAKAISYDARLIIMDEPTSAITEREVDHLHRMIRSLKSTGVAVIYITHKMDEVFKVADRVTVFRDGRHVATVAAEELDRAKLISLMVGRELTHMFPKEHAEIGEVVLSVRGLTRKGKVDNVSFDVHRGEILGIAGLMGAGRTEILEGIFGVAKIDAGEIVMNGKPIRIREPGDAIAAGIGLLTEDRKLTGIMGVLSVRDNMTIASLGRFSPTGILDRRRMDAACRAQRDALAIKTPTLDQLIKLLSGGNQQKVLVSRWLLTTPEVLMIDEPTRGIDVGAKAEIHRLMSQLAGEGKAIIMVSSEMPEILGMSDRVIVIHEGRITGEFTRAEVTQEKIMAAATGLATAA
ncbi:MAG TPA: sugar ABC transporter ATP-binding protein [Candidatus Limnocylindrales bacterium]|nr:sugar ABC transporter ATP-binding protein [Candidatus Limnocylindrales bacterium]